MVSGTVPITITLNGKYDTMIGTLAEDSSGTLQILITAMSAT